MDYLIGEIFTLLIVMLFIVQFVPRFIDTLPDRPYKPNEVVHEGKKGNWQIVYRGKDKFVVQMPCSILLANRQSWKDGKELSSEDAVDAYIEERERHDEELEKAWRR